MGHTTEAEIAITSRKYEQPLCHSATSDSCVFVNSPAGGRKLHTALYRERYSRMTTGGAVAGLLLPAALYFLLLFQSERPPL